MFPLPEEKVSYRYLLQTMMFHADELRLELISAEYPEPYAELAFRDRAWFRVASMLLDRLIGYLQDRILELYGEYPTKMS